jgi:hypothetical protein
MRLPGGLGEAELEQRMDGSFNLARQVGPGITFNEGKLLLSPSIS